MSEKSNARGITMPGFKLHYRAIETKPAWSGTKTDTWTIGIEDPDVNPHSYSCLVSGKGGKNIF
jgi:hypothetical protein